MVRSVIASLLLLTGSSVFAATHRFGVVGGQSEALCLASAGALVEVGTTVSVVAPDGSSQFQAVVEDPQAGCPTLERAAVTGPFYSLRTAQPLGSLTLPAVGVIGETTNLPQIRSCTQNGAIHLTAWSGVPLKSKRLWYQYFYLGLDVESTCTKRDTE